MSDSWGQCGQVQDEFGFRPVDPQFRTACERRLDVERVALEVEHRSVELGQALRQLQFPDSASLQAQVTYFERAD
jgi:hypothetical protein